MPYQIMTHNLPSATPGTSRLIKAHHFGQVGARPKVYLQAGLHADEWPGFLVLNELIKKLNGGIVDTKFPINWQHYKNTILLTQHDELKQLRTKIYKIINL